MKKAIDDTFMRVRGVHVPGISKLIEDYTQDLGEYITVRYLEEHKRWYHKEQELCKVKERCRGSGRSCWFAQWRDDEHLHRRVFRVYADEPGFEDRAIWIASSREITFETNGHYLRDETMRTAIKDVFSMYPEREIKMSFYEHAKHIREVLKTAHQRKMTVIFQDFGPLIKPLPLAAKAKECHFPWCDLFCFVVYACVTWIVCQKIGGFIEI